MLWIKAFILGQSGTVKRVFTYNSCFGLVLPLIVTCDASIYGIGAWIAVGDRPIAYFADDITEVDAEHLGHAANDQSGQSTFEAFALLVASRVWSHLWRQRRVRLSLRSDNLGALAVFSAIKGAAGGMNLVAREFALDCGDGAYEPEVIAHLPVVVNATADVLSRKNDPKYRDTWVPPATLLHAKRVTPLPRTHSW